MTFELSKKFKEVLSYLEVYFNDPIAELIFDLDLRDEITEISFLDWDEKKQQILYLDRDRYTRYKLKYENEYYTEIGKAVDTKGNVIVQKVSNGLFLTDDGSEIYPYMLRVWTYQPALKYSGKIGKTIKKLFPNVHVHQTDLDTFIARLNSIDFVIDESNSYLTKDISEHYMMDRTVDKNTLESSCMKYPGCQYRLSVYDKHPDIDLFVVVNKERKVIGRSLIWQNKYYDRIYSSSNVIGEAMKKHLKEKYGKSVYYDPIKETLQIPIDRSDPNEFPYIDSINFLHEGEELFEFDLILSNKEYVEGYTKILEVDEYLPDAYVRIFRKIGPNTYQQIDNVDRDEVEEEIVAFNDKYFYISDCDDNLKPIIK